jgi:hypothetical protein
MQLLLRSAATHKSAAKRMHDIFQAAHKPAIGQLRDRALDRALRDSDRLSKNAVAHGH